MFNQETFANSNLENFLNNYKDCKENYKIYLEKNNNFQPQNFTLKSTEDYFHQEEKILNNYITLKTKTKPTLVIEENLIHFNNVENLKLNKHEDRQNLLQFLLYKFKQFHKKPNYCHNARFSGKNIMLKDQKKEFLIKRNFSVNYKSFSLQRNVKIAPNQETMINCFEENKKNVNYRKILKFNPGFFEKKKNENKLKKKNLDKNKLKEKNLLIFKKNPNLNILKKNIDSAKIIKNLEKRKSIPNDLDPKKSLFLCSNAIIDNSFQIQNNILNSQLNNVKINQINNPSLKTKQNYYDQLEHPFKKVKFDKLAEQNKLYCINNSSKKNASLFEKNTTEDFNPIFEKQLNEKNGSNKLKYEKALLKNGIELILGRNPLTINLKHKTENFIDKLKNSNLEKENKPIDIEFNRNLKNDKVIHQFKNEAVESHKKEKSFPLLNNLQLLNNYKIRKTIGKGAFGIVKKAISIITSEIFAVKIIKMKKLRIKYRIKGKNLNEDMKKEIAILKKINHPNIIFLKEVLYSEKKDKMYFFMEYLNKGNVKKLKNIDNPPNEDLKIFKLTLFKIIDALRYLHDFVDIAHLDIKEENIMLDDNNGIKIIDFGCSKFLSSCKLIKNSNLNGTKGYQPPEINNKKNELIDGTKVDIWALGVLIYYLITGRRIFINTKIHHQIFLDNLFFPSWVCLFLKNLIKACLNFDPINRPSASILLKHRYFKDGNIEQVTLQNYEKILLTKVEIENSIINIEKSVFLTTKLIKCSSVMKQKISLKKNDCNFYLLN